MNKRIRKKKGLSKIREEECWALNVNLAKHILPRLIRYKQVNQMSYPFGFNSLEEWHEAIDKMIWSFEKVIKDDWNSSDILSNNNWNIEKYKSEKERYLEGMHLFADYFNDLWD